MEKMTGESKDIVAERLEQLKALVPTAFAADGKIDFDALKAELGEAVDSSKEHYRFIWNGKEEARAFALRPSMGTLRPCIEESSGKDGTAGKFDSDNLYIEGDNLEVLKLLQGGYHNAVKMIYIDPPYNTGHDFVYADDFSDSIKNYKEQTGQSDGEGKATHANAETSGRYHTDWLNMMFPRLLLARNLLRDDGVIFISIDGSEIANLRKVCDEVFGESNFVNEFCWVNNLKGRQISTYGAATTFEYVLCYARSVDKVNEFLANVEWLKEKMPTTYRSKDYEVRMDAIGSYVIKNELYNTNSSFNEETRPTLVFQIFYNSDTGDVKVGDLDTACPVNYTAIQPHANADGSHSYHAWRWSKEKVLSESEDLEFIKDGETYKIYTKIRDYQSMTVKNLITDISTGDLGDLFEKKVFDFVKPTALIDVLLTASGCKSDDIVMDYFAGSSTTAHSVLGCNAATGTRCRFVMVQLPDLCVKSSVAAKAGYKNICEIGKERIRRAGKKIKEENATTVPNLDIGFKVFKLDTSNIIPWNPNPEDLKASLLATIENAVEGRTVDDILYEILLKCNLPLTLPIEKKVFGENTINVVGEGVLMICLDKPIKAAVAEEMVRLRDEVYKPEVAMQVVFLDNGFTDKEKANAIAALVQAGVEEKSILSI